MRAASALNAKLVRDLVRLSGPATAIAAIVACGIMAYVGLRGTYVSLARSRDGFYERTRFAHITAGVVRAPVALARAAAAIPGVARVDTRITGLVTADIPGFADPVRLQATSLPDDPDASSNLVIPVQGALPGRGEVLLGEAFALAHDLRRGDVLSLTIRGTRRDFTIAGHAVSPDAVYVLAPGTMWPDDQRTGVAWLRRQDLEGALDLRGAFTELVVAVAPDVNVDAVVVDLDALLAPWGTSGALPRAQQASERFVTEELHQLEAMTRSVPLLFLAVSAFVLHNVISRLLQTERETIALLKALGYRRGQIAAHYLLLSGAVVFGGAVVGVVGGFAVVRFFVRLYRDYFRFDHLNVFFDGGVVIVAVAAAVAAAFAGAWRPVRAATAVPPAVAMQPPSPPSYRRGWLDRSGVVRWLGSGARLVARTLARRGLRTLLSVVGLALAGAIVVAASVVWDSMARMVDIAFRVQAREDIAVGFVSARSASALAEIARLPGVVVIEGERSVGVRLRGPTASWEGGLVARPEDGTLRPFVDHDGHRGPSPGAGGLALTDALARRLGVGPGDDVVVERLDRARRAGDVPLVVPVVALTREPLGLQATTTTTTARRWWAEGDLFTGALLRVDEPRRDALLSELRRRPQVAGASSRSAAIASFERLLADSIALMRVLLAAFASVIAVGVVYNDGRIALAEQARDLATLRVLGFTRREVAWLFLGGEAVLVLLSVPLSWVIGRAFTAGIIAALGYTDLFRFDVVTRAETYAGASGVVVAAAIVTGVLLKRRLDRLDLVAVLKARE